MFVFRLILRICGKYDFWFRQYLKCSNDWHNITAAACTCLVYIHTTWNGGVHGLNVTKESRNRIHRNGGIEKKNSGGYHFYGRPIRLIIYSFSVCVVNGDRAIDACQMRRRGNAERSDEFVLLFGNDCAKSIEICVRVSQGTLFYVFYATKKKKKTYNNA